MDKEIIFENKKIYYQTSGNGRPVLLIHGFGEDGSIWKNQIDFLKSKFKLIVPDLPGSGQSEMTDDMSIEGMAEVIKAIFDVESLEIKSVDGFKKVCMIGHSMGGYITLAFAGKFSGLLNSFGLFHSTAFADSEEKKELRKKVMNFVKKHDAEKFLKTTLPNLFSAQTQKDNPGIISNQIKSSSNFKNEAIIKYYEAMMNRPDRTFVLKNSSLPVLFIAGEYDQTVSLNDSLKQCHLPDISYFHILQKSAHMGMIEEAENCNQILERFLLRNAD